MASSPNEDSKYPIITDLINDLLAIQRDYRTVSIDSAIAEVVVARQTKASLIENLEAKDALIANLTTILGEKLPSASYTKEDVLAKLLLADGVGSGLDADKLQGKVPSDFATSAQGTKADNALPNSDIAVATLGVAAPFTSGFVKYSKLLGIVFITVSATSNNVGNNVVLCNLPAEYRPSTEILVPIFVVTGSGLWGYNKCGLKVGADGNVTFVTETTESTKAIYCSFSYHI